MIYFISYTHVYKGVHSRRQHFRSVASTSVQRHPLPFRCSTSVWRHPFETFKIKVFLVSTSGNPSYFALGCSKLLACRYSAEHGVTFDTDSSSCCNVRRRLEYQKLKPASVYDTRVYLPNKSSVDEYILCLKNS